MPGKHNGSVNILSLQSFASAIWTQVKKRHISAIVLFGLLACGAGYAQTPTPTPITKPDPPTVQTPSTVGRITKWTGAAKNGFGIIGDSVMTESAGNIGVGILNP